MSRLVQVIGQRLFHEHDSASIRSLKPRLYAQFAPPYVAFICQ